MADNKKVSDNLRQAKNAKNDEFFTQYNDVKKEIDAYFTLNADIFKDKTVLLPCDDPERSEFVKYFISHFESFKLKKLICSCYVVGDKGKVLEVTGKNIKNGRLNWKYLNKLCYYILIIKTV